MSKYHKAARECPVCGGMMGETCEVCGTPELRGMRLILQPETKEDVTEGLWCMIKAMERDAKQMPEKVWITVKPSEGLGFGVEFSVEWE